MNYNILLFGILAIIFIVIITLSIKLLNLRSKRLLPCDNIPTNNINVVNEYQENLNDTPFKTPVSSQKKLKFNDIVNVRVFG